MRVLILKILVEQKNNDKKFQSPPLLPVVENDAVGERSQILVVFVEILENFDLSCQILAFAFLRLKFRVENII